jgi:hypothetical protein
MLKQQSFSKEVTSNAERGKTNGNEQDMTAITLLILTIIKRWKAYELEILLRADRNTP